MNATCYQFRNASGQKIVGGALGMSRAISLDEGAAIVAGMLGVDVSPSGRVRFTWKGAEVSVHLSLDASQTEKGREALRAWRAERAERAQRDNREPCECCGHVHD